MLITNLVCTKMFVQIYIQNIYVNYENCEKNGLIYT